MKRKQIFILALVLTLLFALAAPAAAEQGGAGELRIAFLDSGISLKHLDGTQVAEGENLVFPERGTDDRVGHGTATAGIVLGSAELGLAGVCPEAVAVPLVCYDTYPSGVSVPGGAETLAAAIYAAVDRYGCRVINISMGTTENSDALRAAVEYAEAKNAVVVSAVGNDNRTEPESVFYPASYATVIGVGAADGERAADFSQRHGVDVVAPGVLLETVTNRNAAETQRRSGTSFACAYVSGLCAALLLRQPELTAAEVREALFAGAQDIAAPGFDADTGWGLVSLPDAVPEPDGLADALACAAALARFFGAVLLAPML